jgi:hypothetical protein
LSGRSWAAAGAQPNANPINANVRGLARTMAPLDVKARRRPDLWPEPGERPPSYSKPPGADGGRQANIAGFLQR